MRRRGKHNQKHYTVFIAGLDNAQDRHSYIPQLNHEHSTYRWWKWSELTGPDAPALHPVVNRLVTGIVAWLFAVVG